MSSIRPLEPADLPAVAALANWAFAGGERTSTPQMEAFLRDTLLDSPWADPELPSLVAVDDGDRVVGFIGSHPRRLVAGGRTVRAACCSHLVVDPDARADASGSLLLSTWMRAGQELSYSDTANDIVARMWQAFGGTVDQLKSTDFMRVLRPGPWTAQVAGRRASGRGEWGLAPVRALPFNLGAAPADSGDGPAVTSAPLDAEGLVAALREVGGGLRLRLDADADFARWLLAGIEAIAGTRRVFRRVVRRGDRTIGWFVGFLVPGGRAWVLEVGAREREVDAVLDELERHTAAEGALVLVGRAEPHLAEALRGRHAVLGFDARHVVHSRDPELLALLPTRRTLLTRLAGEWW